MAASTSLHRFQQPCVLRYSLLPHLAAGPPAAAATNSCGCCRLHSRSAARLTTATAASRFLVVAKREWAWQPSAIVQGQFYCEAGSGGDSSVRGRRDEEEAKRSELEAFERGRMKEKVLWARDEPFKEAVAALRSSQVIAVPTDTLYGLACDACSSDAIQRIYEIKARNPSSPLAVCVADVENVASYGETSHLPTGLLGSLLPGAVTLLLPRGESTRLSSSLNPGVASIGIRIPDNDFIRGVSRSFGGALALTSANISSHLSTVRVEEFEHLWPQCAYVFDAGVLPGGRAGSTIVDLTEEGTFKVIRSGSVLQETKEVLVKFGLREVTTLRMSSS